MLYLLEGELRYWFAVRDQKIGPGTAVHLPCGVWFRRANERDEPARMLCMFAPAGFERFFLELGQAAQAAG